MTSTLGAWVVIAACAVPAVLACGLSSRALRPLAITLAPWSALPVFVATLALSRTAIVRSDVILFGASLGMPDVTARVFLVLTASVWLGAGLYARRSVASDAHRVRFWGFFLATATGNFGVVLAQDVASFYLLFALMTYAAYGLVIHEQSDEARRAARIYFIMALVGEMLLLAGFLAIVGTAIDLPLRSVPEAVVAARSPTLISALLLAGFGIKAGALALHVWLPLAHPVAPTPASAVLSGAMIKAGLLGWLRFLPLGHIALPDVGLACCLAGLAGALYAAIVGLTQSKPKTILAYSSVSQMGFAIAAIGVTLAVPAAAPIAVPTLLFFALHHALAKGALFLGAGVASHTGAGWVRWGVLFGLALPALDIAGAPLSSGALAKISLKNVMTRAPWGGGQWVSSVLSIGAVGSTLLMVHFLRRACPRGNHEGAGPALWMPWAMLIVLDILAFIHPPMARADLAILVEPTHVLSAAWPVLAGIAAYMVSALLNRRGIAIRASIPPGDLVVVYERAWRVVRRLVSMVVLAVVRTGSRIAAWVDQHLSIGRLWESIVGSASLAESRLAGFGTIGLVLLVLVLLGVAMVSSA